MIRFVDLKCIIVALIFFNLFVFSSCSSRNSIVDDAFHCEDCGKVLSDNMHDSVSTEKSGVICIDCALNPKYTICHSCGQFADYAWYEWECDYGYCYDCSQKLLRICGMCEDGPFVKSNMFYLRGYYVCANCIYEAALQFDNEDDVFQFISENDVFYPEDE